MAAILIIEDDEALRAMLRDLLTRLRYDVYEAADGNEGIQLADAIRPALILLDLMMPNMPGEMALEYIRKSPSLVKTPVIIISAHPNGQAIATALGADAFLRKPFRMAELKELAQKFIPAVP